jgi:RNA polymerase sigma-70 factor (ECF subfamily)
VLAATTEDRPVPPKAYLFAAAHNVVMNHHRRSRVRRILQPIEASGDNLIDDAPDAERSLIAQQRVELLWEAVDQLPARTRQIFIMRKVERLRNPEIAEELGISVSAVEKHVRKGLRICRAYLDQLDKERPSEQTELGDGTGAHHA